MSRATAASTLDVSRQPLEALVAAGQPHPVKLERINVMPPQSDLAERDLTPSADALFREREELASTPWAPGMRVTDAVITPFTRALIADGFVIKKRNGSCDELSKCDVCHNGYVVTAIRHNIEGKHCPHCRHDFDLKRGVFPQSVRAALASRT